MSVQFSGSLAITGSLVTTGQIIAQTLNVQQVTSSIIYSSGSNVFGNSLSNTQIMTGSVSVTGSLDVAGNVTGTSAAFSGAVTVSDGTTTIRSVSASGLGLFGTFTNHPLVFRINNTEAARISTAANFLIKTTTDNGTDALQVAGSGRFSSSVTANGLISNFTSNANSNNGLNIVNSGTVGYGGAVTFNIGSGGINYNSARIYSENDGTGGTFRIQTANTSQVLSDRLTISNSGAATFSSSVTATGGTASYSTSALPTATISTTTTGAINAAYTSIRIGARGQSGQDQSVAITNVPTADGNSAIAFTTIDSYSYAERMRITSGGNLGLGVTPSAWNSAFGSVLQFKSAGSNGGGALTGSGGSNFRMFANTFYDGLYKYIVNGAATQYEQDGYHAWSVAPSGTAGNAISFTQAMTLTGGGNLLIKTTSDNGTDALQVAGSGRFSGNTTGGFVGVTIANANTGAAQIALNNSAQSWLVNTRTDNHFSIFNATASTTPFFINTSGNVGIGTTSPTDRVSITSGALTVGFGDNDRSTLQGGSGFGSLLRLYNGSGTETVRMDAGGGGGTSWITSGNVGIGTTSPQAKLHVAQSASAVIFSESSSVATIIGTNAAGTSSQELSLRGFPLTFTGNGGGSAEQMRLTSGGNLLIKTTTDNGTDALQVAGSVSATSNILTNGEFRVNPASGDGIVRMYTAGTERAAVRANATKFYIEVGTFGERLAINNSSGLLTYTGAATFSSSVTANGGLNLTGGTLPTVTGSTLAYAYSSANHDFAFGDGTGYSLRFVKRVSSTTTPLFTLTDGGAATFSSLGTGTVYSNGGTLTNTNPSDQNLKENIDDLGYGLDEILQLRPVTFTWKYDKINQGTQYGFIAQEVQEIMPDLVKDGEYLGLDKEAIFTTLVKAIQELKAENDTLKEILQRNNIQ